MIQSSAGSDPAQVKTELKLSNLPKDQKNGGVERVNGSSTKPLEILRTARATHGVRGLKRNVESGLISKKEDGTYGVAQWTQKNISLPGLAPLQPPTPPKKKKKKKNKHHTPTHQKFPCCVVCDGGNVGTNSKKRNEGRAPMTLKKTQYAGIKSRGWREPGIAKKGRKKITQKGRRNALTGHRLIKQLLKGGGIQERFTFQEGKNKTAVSRHPKPEEPEEGSS